MAQTFIGGSVNSYDTMGPGQAGPKLGIYSEEATQTSALGTKKVFDDARVYKYAHWVAACTVGKLCAQDFSVSGTVSVDGKFVSSAGAAKDDYTTTDDVIYLLDTDTFGTADAANVYAGGYLSITDAAGEGYQYRIKSNDLGTAAGLMKLVLYDKLAAALDSETSCAIIGSMYKNLRINTAPGTDNITAGATARSMTAAYYGWVQTWGPATILADGSAGTIAAGSIATVSDGVSGAVQPISGGYTQASEALITSDFDFTPIVTENIVGFFMNTATDTEYTQVYLQLSQC